VDPGAVGVVSEVGRGMGVLDGVIIVEGKWQFWEWIWGVPFRSCARATHSSQITLRRRTCYSTHWLPSSMTEWLLSRRGGSNSGRRQDDNCSVLYA